MLCGSEHWDPLVGNETNDKFLPGFLKCVARHLKLRDGWVPKCQWLHTKQIHYTIRYENTIFREHCSSCGYGSPALVIGWHCSLLLALRLTIRVLVHNLLCSRTVQNGLFSAESWINRTFAITRPSFLYQSAASLKLSGTAMPGQRSRMGAVRTR